MWPDSTVYIIGGGPSLDGMDWEMLHGRKTIGCNDAYRLGAWVDIHCFGDSDWFEIHRKCLMKRGGLRITCAHELLRERGVLVIQRMPRGVFLQPHKIGWNSNTGALAINLAIKFGAKKVVLLGFDMKLGPRSRGKGRRSNWYKNLKNSEQDPDVYEKFLDHFKFMAKQLKKKTPDVEIINTSMDSALGHFPKVPLEEVLANEDS